ncbi:MAG: response regulator transcription factor [Acidimicrobiales bacterium]
MSEPSLAQKRVLVVDDEEYLTDLLSTSLRFQGFEVETATNGLQALSKAESFDPELILLDVLMPDIDGLEVCRRLRSVGNAVPVIFLTARDTKADLLAGFTIGGDDYITKPFSLEEVVVRIRAVLKRATTGVVEQELLEYADVVMDETTYVVTRGDREIDLSPTEWRLLRYLLMNAERVLSKQQILSYVWHYDHGGEEGSVETYISYLRKKLDHENEPLIHTLRGVGYTLRSRTR